MKSLRQDMLIHLAKSEHTVDEMIDSVTGYTRKQLADNLQQCFVEKLVTRRKDDTTGMPCYTITDLGKSRIKSDAKSVTEDIEKARKIEPVASVETTVKAKASDGGRPVIESLCYIEEISALHKENNVLELALALETKKCDDLSKKLSAEQKSNENLLIENNALRDSLASECDERKRLQSENVALQVLNTDMPGFAATYFAKKEYLVRSNTAPVITKSFDRAQKAAKRSVMTHGGTAQVYALVKAGKARRGAEWVQE
jgi:hypothetical protein